MPLVEPDEVVTRDRLHGGTGRVRPAGISPEEHALELAEGQLLRIMNVAPTTTQVESMMFLRVDQFTFFISPSVSTRKSTEPGRDATNQ